MFNPNDTLLFQLKLYCACFCFVFLRLFKDVDNVTPSLLRENWEANAHINICDGKGGKRNSG